MSAYDDNGNGDYFCIRSIWLCDVLFKSTSESIHLASFSDLKQNSAGSAAFADDAGPWMLHGYGYSDSFDDAYFIPDCNRSTWF